MKSARIALGSFFLAALVSANIGCDSGKKSTEKPVDLKPAGDPTGGTDLNPKGGKAPVVPPAKP